MSELRERYVEQIRQDSDRLPADLAAAFAAVPREAFVAAGFKRRDGSWARPGDRDFLDLVYRDDVLVTKVAGQLPVSSSSQPSLMAIMLDALDVRPGATVLEIGAGTGYNAALLSALGARVTSVDVQPDVADRAREALARAGIAGVDVRHGDGYLGAPDATFDRVIVTVGVAGVSPHWLGQLRAGPATAGQAAAGGPGGFVVVPVEHAGTHPVLLVRGTSEGPVTATVVCPSGFMTASGPLAAPHPHTHPAAGRLPGLAPASGPRWDHPLDPSAYRDLWYAAGIWHPRATLAAIRRHDQSSIALLDDDRSGGAAILADGTILATGPEAAHYAAEAAAIIDRWESTGRPPMQAWRIRLALAGDPGAPIWAPADWCLA